MFSFIGDIKSKKKKNFYIFKTSGMLQVCFVLLCFFKQAYLFNLITLITFETFYCTNDCQKIMTIKH